MAIMTLICSGWTLTTQLIKILLLLVSAVVRAPPALAFRLMWNGITLTLPWFTLISNLEILVLPTKVVLAQAQARLQATAQVELCLLALIYARPILLPLTRPVYKAVWSAALK